MNAHQAKASQFLGALLFSLGLLNLLSRHYTEYAFIALAVTLVAYISLTENEHRIKKLFPSLKFDLLYFSWFLILIVSHLVNRNLGEHEISEISEYRWLIGVYLIASTLSITGFNRKYFNLFLIATTAICLYFAIDFFQHPQFPGYIGYPNRMVGFLSSPTDFGHSIIFLFLTSATLLLLSKFYDSRLNYLIALLATIATGSNLFFSQTRAVFLTAVICLSGVAVYISRQLALKIALSAIALSLLFYYVDFLGFKERVDYSLGPQQTYDSARVKLWRGHIELIKENFFFGVGYHHNQFHLRPIYDRLGFPPDTQQAHAHNQFLNIFAGTGIFGLLWYLAIMILFIRMSIQNTRAFPNRSLEHQISVVTTVVLCGFLASGLTDTNFELMAPKYYLLLTWGIILYLSKKRELVKP